MIRDGDVFVTARAGGRGHLCEGGAPVALGGVHVQVAADVRQFHQLGQAVFGGALDLAQVFAQLRRNPAQPQRLVDAGFGFARHLSFVRATIQAVFAQLETHLYRARADGHVVVFAAGEVLEGRAEAFARQRAHVHLQAFAAHSGAGLILAARQEFFHLGEAHKTFQHVSRCGTGDQQIEIAHGFATAPQAAGGGNLLDTRRLAQVAGQLARHVLGIAQQIAAGALAVLRDGFEHLLFQLGAHARQHAQLLIEA